MINQFKEQIRDFFTLNRGEQRAIIIVLLLAILVAFINVLIPYFSDTSEADDPDFMKRVEAFKSGRQDYYDSLRIEELQNRGELDLTLARQKLKPFPFDPNAMKKEDWEKMGLTEKQIRNIENYKAKGGQFTSREGFKKLYTLSDAEFEILEPYIVIEVSKDETRPNRTKKNKPAPSTIAAENPKQNLTELNAADSAELVDQLNLPGWLAKNMLNYRKNLGGFVDLNQLAEVYGFDTARFSSKRQYVTIDTSLVEKMNINTCSFKQLVGHPYISYELTRQIMDKRLENGDLNSIRFLLDDELVTDSLFVKLRPYLTSGNSE